MSEIYKTFEVLENRGERLVEIDKPAFFFGFASCNMSGPLHSMEEENQQVEEGKPETPQDLLCFPITIFFV